MKTLGKIIICIIVVLCAVGIAYLVYNCNEKETNNNSVLQNNNTSINTTNKIEENETNNELNENTDYIGEEENKEEPKEDSKQEKVESEQEETTELTGKDKAIDIVKKQYALDGQTVRFDHMEGNDYIIKLNDGTAVTWYLVNGTTWEAEEY